VQNLETDFQHRSIILAIQQMDERIEVYSFRSQVLGAA